MVQEILSTAATGLQRTSQIVADAASTIVQDGARSSSATTSSVASATLAGAAGIEAQTINSRLGGDFVTAFSNIIRAEAAYSANVALIQTAQEISDETVNLIA